MSWLTGWSRRKLKIVIGTVDGIQTNFQMLTIRVHRATGTDTPSGANDTIQHIHAGVNVRTDFGDVRFTAADGITLLPYWMVSFTSGVFADFVVRVPSIPANPGQVTIFVYYGNPIETSISNGANTFEFFDDFSTNTVGNYQMFIIHPGGTNNMSWDSVNQRLNFTVSFSWVALVQTVFGMSDMLVVEANIFCDTRWDGVGTFGLSARRPLNNSPDEGVVQIVRYYTDGLAMRGSVNHTSMGWIPQLNRVYHLSLASMGTMHSVSVMGGAAEPRRTHSENIGRVFSNRIGFYINRINGWIDDLRVRKHTPTHPTWGATGAEELQPVEVVILQTDTIIATDTISHIEISQADTIAATDIISYRKIQVADTIIATDHAPQITKDDIVWIYVIDTIAAIDTISHREIQQIDTIAATDVVALIIPQTDTIIATDRIVHISLLQTDIITATDRIAHIGIIGADTIIATDTVSARTIQLADTIVGTDVVSGCILRVLDLMTATDVVASRIAVSRDVIIDVGRDSVVKCTVSHNINDATRICTCEIKGSVPLREYEFFTITDKDIFGNPQVIFFGFAVIIRKTTDGGLNTMSLHAFDAGYYLTTQNITMGDIRSWSDRTLSFEPTFKIWQMLGGHNWLSTTTINPISLFPTPHGRPLRQFDFKTTDKLQKVFTELADWYDAIFTLSYNVRAAGQVETRAHFVHRSVIDRDLPLPPQVIFTNPSNSILSHDIETDHERLVNRVRVNGIWAERGEWFFTSRSTTLAADELIREHVEEFTPQPTPATRAEFEARVTARLNQLFEILTDTRRAQFLTFSIKNRSDLRLFQLVSFAGFADIPTFTWRIVEITYNIVAASSVQTVKCVFDTYNNTSLSIPKVREILNAEDGVRHIQNICEGEIEKLPEILVGRVISVSADGRHAEIELERGLQRVRVRIV